MCRSGLMASLALSLCAHIVSAQSARISEEQIDIKTYPFGGPDANPIFLKDARLYPYHTFESYSKEGEIQTWNVVKLENDYVEVYVLPDAGGKIWGAIEKSTGNEFIYRNEVMKFRNIALRGPWTSGGIEFNFGVIGHTPATASPVDYTLVENPDGSVSCIVGAMDLPSRTQWRVEIRLPADRAYFETRTTWYNPTPVSQSYYNWMTAAAFATDDLEVIFPGDEYLKHSGEAKSWPLDEQGRDLSVYSNNNFDGAKSYHVVGEYTDFFGGYYKDDDYGFGHWSPYSDMPGQKLWVWALSREGGIWEDLLTDTDGQYIEFQAGRLLVQYSPGTHVNPITQAASEPGRTDEWTEIWFPLKQIGGMSDASPLGALHVERTDTGLQVGINAFITASGYLVVTKGDEEVFRLGMEFSPMEALNLHVPVGTGEDYVVSVPELGLRYDLNPEALRLQRPFETNAQAKRTIPEADRLAFEGRELLKGRRYGDAMDRFESVLAVNPWHRMALMGMADLFYRRAWYEEGLNVVNRVLQLDAYDADANYMAGILHRAEENRLDAREAFGWAARSLTYRSSASIQLAEMAMQEGDYAEAGLLAWTALDYNRRSVNGWEIVALTSRISGDRESADDEFEQLLQIDPLHHLKYFEEYLRDPSETNREAFLGRIRSEYQDQTVLELAISYYNRGLFEEALVLLEIGSEMAPNPLFQAWKAYILYKDGTASFQAYLDRARRMSPAFVFPYRRETIDVLVWAEDRDDHWIWKYYLALNYWAKDRIKEAGDLLEAAGDLPSNAPFYITRAHLPGRDADAREKDLRRALQMDNTQWPIWRHLIQFYQDKGRWEDALSQSSEAYRAFPGDFKAAVTHARILLHSDHADEALEILERVHVLPSESARESHRLYEWANVSVALDKIAVGDYDGAILNLNAGLEWPERLGQGRPYEPESRLIQYLLGFCYLQVGEEALADAAVQSLVDYTFKFAGRSALEHYLGYILLESSGNPEHAERLIGLLVSGSHSSQPATRWVVASARKDDAELYSLDRDHHGLFEQMQFRLIDRALDLSGVER